MAGHGWVTVYGFDLELASDVFTLFEGFGDILDHRVGASANSMDVLFATRETMEFALAQDGLRINIGADNATCIMIGVKRAAQDDPHQQWRRRPTASGARDREERMAGAGPMTVRNSTPGRRTPGRTPGRTPQRSAPPEHNTQSKHGRSLFVSTADRQYASYATPGYGREPRKDLSCCQMAARYLFPQSW